MPFTDDFNNNPTGRGPNAGGGGEGAGLIGAALQTGAALYDSHQDRKLSRENTNKTIAANKAEAELAYQRSVQMWEAQNAYNTPQAQMQRFIDAGLNPHLIYGQGNAGNASSPPSYAPPNVQYQYQSGKYGAAIASALPTLMAVGSWLQNMRASEAQIRKTESDTTRVDQVVDYLQSANPKLLEKLQGEVTLLPGQKVLQDIKRDQMVQSLRDLETEFRQKYGDELWKQYGSNFRNVGNAGDVKIGGTEAQKFLLGKQKVLQAEFETKLKGAQASWTDFDITNPQQIMLMVLNGVLGMAGGALRLPGKGSARPVQSTKARPSGLRRVHPSRRVQSKPKGYYD